MAKFIEIIDNRGIKHYISIAQIEQVYELGVKGKETCICLPHDRIISLTPYNDIVKMINKKGGLLWL